MADFMQFTSKDGRTVFINRDMITDFSFDDTQGATVVSLPGDNNYLLLHGNQVESILRGWTKPPKGVQDEN